MNRRTGIVALGVLIWLLMATALEAMAFLLLFTPRIPAGRISIICAVATILLIATRAFLSHLWEIKRQEGRRLANTASKVALCLWYFGVLPFLGVATSYWR